MLLEVQLDVISSISVIIPAKIQKTKKTNMIHRILSIHYKDIIIAYGKTELLMQLPVDMFHRTLWENIFKLKN